MKKEQTFKQQVDAIISLFEDETKKKRVLSGNEVQQLLKLRCVMAKLCPETDGLQGRYRIRYEPRGRNRREKEEDIVNYVYDNCPFLQQGMHFITKGDAHFVALVYAFDGFSSREVYRLLRKENVKNYM